MRSFTTFHSKVVLGIETLADERLGRVVFLGEEGRGRVYEKIKLDQRRPPLVNGDNRVEDADVVEFEAGGRKRYALTAGRGGDPRILLRVFTGRGYTRRGCGHAEGYLGNPVTLVSGHGADGDAGRIGTWMDYLMVVQPGEAIFVQPSGGVDGYVLHYRIAGETPQIWKTEEFRTEVIAPWAEGAKVEDVEVALARATERRQEKMASILRAKLAERALSSGETTTLRRNVRWDDSRKAVVVDSVTVFRGTEVKTDVVLADAADPAEALAASRILAEHSADAKALTTAIYAESGTLAAADPTRQTRQVSGYESVPAIAELLLGCVTEEEALRRDLSGITLDRWISAEDQRQIRAARPATIVVLSLGKPVEYAYGRPSVKINFTELSAAAWRAASGSLALPDGTTVSVTVRGEGWEASTSKGDLALLPAKISEAAARAQIRLWAPPPPPEPIELLDGDTPPVLRVIYGQDILTGESLWAYGSWAFGWYGDWSVTYWMSEVEAGGAPGSLDETCLSKVRAALKRRAEERAAKLIQEEAARREAAEKAAAMETADGLLARMRKIPYYGLPEALQVDDLRNYGSYRYQTSEQIIEWVTAAEPRIIAAEAEVARLAVVEETERLERKAQGANDDSANRVWALDISVKPSASTTHTPSTTFEDKGGRHFRCQCGCMERVEKGVFQRYQAGEAITVTCSLCRKTGTVKR